MIHTEGRFTVNIYRPELIEVVLGGRYHPSPEVLLTAVSLLPRWHQASSSWHSHSLPISGCRRGTNHCHPSAAHPQHLLHFLHLWMIWLISTFDTLKRRRPEGGWVDGGVGGCRCGLPPFFPPVCIFSISLFSFSTFLLLLSALHFPLFTGELWNNLRLVGFLHILISN